MRVIIFICLAQFLEGARTRPNSNDHGRRVQLQTNLGGALNGATCCCRIGKCDHDEHCADPGLNEFRAVENHEDGAELCCTWSSTVCALPAQTKSKEFCESRRQMEINAVIESAAPEKCQGQLRALTNLVKDKLHQHHRRFFHGTDIHTIHFARAAETINHKLLIEDGYPFDDSSIGINFFVHLPKTKLLWNEIEKSNRALWKDALEAGELSRGEDTAFAEIVENSTVAQLRACDYNTVKPIANIWKVASLSYASADESKPLVIIIGKKDEDSLSTTMLWKAELQGVAFHPPKGGVSVISVGGFNCDALMDRLKKRIEEHVKGFKAAMRRWTKTESFTCRSSEASRPTQGDGKSYMAPFQEQGNEENFWLDLWKQGGGPFYGRYYSKQMCLRKHFSRWSYSDEWDVYLKGKVLLQAKMSWQDAYEKCADLEACAGFYTSSKSGDFRRFSRIRNNTDPHDSQHLDISFCDSQELARPLGWMLRTAAAAAAYGLAAASLAAASDFAAGGAALLDVGGSAGVQMATTHWLNGKERYISLLKIKESVLPSVADDDWVKAAIAEQCPKDMIRFSASNSKVTEAGVIEVASNCPNLKSIHLRGVPITDLGLKAIGANCPRLRELVLSDESPITIKGLQEFWETSKQKVQRLCVPHHLSGFLEKKKTRC